MYFDVHCHFFSKDIFTSIGNLGSRFMFDIGEGIKKRLNGFEHYFDVLQVEEDIEKIFFEMESVYGKKFAFCPLGIDLYYMGFLLPIFSDSFDSQMVFLEKLKKKYPHRIYPFLPIDPRRNETRNLLALIKDKVGAGKPFVGIKLYTALGYSPLDSLFMQKGGIYEYCQKNRIPITVHAGFGGIYSFEDKIKSSAEIYNPLLKQVVPAQECGEGGYVDFSRFKHLEIKNKHLKGYVFNHTELWKRVLKKYPKLTINFAHLGGDRLIKEYLNSTAESFYVRDLLEMMRQYPNVYTELSCFVDNEKKGYSLSAVKNEIYDRLPKHVKNRFLYGSDYFLLKTKGESLRSYYEHFKKVFGKDYEMMAKKNSYSFLKNGMTKLSWWRRFFQ